VDDIGSILHDGIAVVFEFVSVVGFGVVVVNCGCGLSGFGRELCSIPVVMLLLLLGGNNDEVYIPLSGVTPVVKHGGDGSAICTPSPPSSSPPTLLLLLFPHRDEYGNKCL
jgi:hypothetical protein